MVPLRRVEFALETDAVVAGGGLRVPWAALKLTLSLLPSSVITSLLLMIARVPLAAL